MQIIRQQNAIKSHFSIIPYGITMSKIFSFLFIVPNDSTVFSYPLIPVGHNYYLFLIFLFIFEMIDWTLWSRWLVR